ncbi:type IX secretion system ring subunit PorN/GldN [Pararhodonellum marinum]|uniref:type IX secretion system ring protein PorN/GldN n=1 Tax=Pararhodonellum marinum TaxID=2755358 RepID=UPI00188E8393|nr:gliding motility protein GldN [Pararhodonellum marinum]
MKQLFKLTGALTLLMAFVLGGEVVAQGNTSITPSNFGDRQFRTDTVFSSRPIREDDKMYQIAVWRRIDLREKFNLSLYGTGVAKLDGIINAIYKAVVDENAIEVFADEEFTQPMSIAEFSNKFWINALGDSIFIKDMYYLDFREDFVFDGHRSEVLFDIKYLEIVMPAGTNAGVSQETVAFIRYKDFYEHFKNHPRHYWINFQNTSKHLPYDQAFDLRLFKSVVRKFTNPNDDLIADMVDPEHPNPDLQAYLNSLAFEYKLLEYESNLWEW